MGNPYQFFINLPFGETMFEQHSYSEDYVNPYKFNGKELDVETNLYYYGARYYDPSTSIWLSVDPLANYNPIQESEHYIEGQHNEGVFNSLNLNVYGYTYQNPIIYIVPNSKQVDFNSIPGLRGIGEGIGRSFQTGMDKLFGGLKGLIIITNDKPMSQQKIKNYLNENIKSSWEDAERLVYKEKGVDYELYKDSKSLINIDSSGDQVESMASFTEFYNDYIDRPGEYQTYAKEYRSILFSDKPLFEKIKVLKELSQKFNIPEVSKYEIAKKWYELNPNMKYLEDD